MSLSIVQAAMDNISEGISSLFDGSPTHTYNASFADTSEHLSRWNYGFSVNGTKFLSRDFSSRHLLLCGASGSGKTVGIIAPSIYNIARSKSSLIINDCSGGELARFTSGFLKRMGYRILYLNFSDASLSECFNIILTCASITDIQRVSFIFIENSIGESSGDNFWKQSAMLVITTVLRLLVFHYPPEYRHFQNVLRIIERMAVDDSVDRLYVEAGDFDLLSSYKALISMGEKTLASVLATCRTALSIFADPEICKTTCTNTINFELLRSEPVCICVSNPIKDQNYLRPIVALFFQSLFNYCLSRIPDERELDIYFIIDEGNYKFPGFTTTMNHCRKFRAKVLLGLQDEQALISLYGAAEAHQIQTNFSTKIYLPPQPLSSCKNLSQILGRYTIPNTNMQRDLLTPDEIRLSKKAIILIGNERPILSSITPYFKHLAFRRYTNIPPVDPSIRKTHIPSLINFNA